MKAEFAGMCLAFTLGAFTGMFVNDVNVFYSCEKDGVFTIDGLFWRGETKFDCQRHRQNKKGEAK